MKPENKNTTEIEDPETFYFKIFQSFFNLQNLFDPKNFQFQIFLVTQKKFYHQNVF